MIIGYFDGGCEPKNPGGVPTYGFVVYQDGELVGEGCGVADEPFGYKATVNVAEYSGLIHLLEYLLAQGWGEEKIKIRGDSQLIIRQMNGIYACRDPKLVPMRKHAAGLTRSFKWLMLEWIRRGENKEADRMAHRAYVEYMDENPGARKQVKLLGHPFVTEKQKALLEKLGVRCGNYISRARASRLIREARKEGADGVR